MKELSLSNVQQVAGGNNVDSVVSPANVSVDNIVVVIVCPLDPFMFDDIMLDDIFFDDCDFDGDFYLA